MPRTSIPHQRLSASQLPPEVEPAERDFMRLLERALAPSFTLVKRLGAGGMGAVYLARDPVLKRLVAVKVMAPTLAADAAARARFEREAQAVASISHPNVVAVYSVGELENGVPFLVMEYVEGRSISEQLKEAGPLDVATAKRVLGEVASALDTAHRKGIIHRDIKPANILWDDETGRALVTDFGIAAVLERGDERDATRITHTGMAVGTPAYMSPEQLLAEPVTEKTDIYSLGLLGYELLSGEGPYQVSSPREVMAAHLRDTPRRISSVRPDVDPELERLLENCLAKDPRQRPSAREVESRLAHGASILLEWPPPGLEHLNEQFRSATRFLLLGALALGIPLVALSVFDRETLVRQSLPPTPALVTIAAIAMFVYLVGCWGVSRVLDVGAKAVANGYGWGTVAEAAADYRGDTGALIAGGREYAALAAHVRSRMRRYRVISATLRLLAGVTPTLGYLIGILIAADSVNGPTVVLWSSIVLSLSLLVAARLILWQEDRSMRSARVRLRTAAAVRREAMGRLAETWTTAFEQVRSGQSLGPGPTRFPRTTRWVVSAVLAIAIVVATGSAVVMSFTMLMSIAAEISVPKFGNTRARVDRIQRLASYRVVPDSGINPLRAGQALHAIIKAGSSAPLLKWENAPAIVISTPPPVEPSSSPFPEDQGGWLSAAFRQARRGFSPAQREFLRTIANNPALEEFAVVAHAPSLDLSAAYWSFPPGAQPRWFELPIPRFSAVKMAANSNAAQAALDFAAGRSQDAEQRLREIISTGFLMIENGSTMMENHFGSAIVANGRISLAAFLEASGRAKEARFVSAENDPVTIALESQAGRRPRLEDAAREIRRIILDTTEVRGLRWELLLAFFAYEPCADMHQLIFGPDSLHRATLAEARKRLVRRSSDSVLFAMAERATENSAAANVVRGKEFHAASRRLGRAVGVITGHRQMEACASLLGLL
jgi:serine/threonine protein kinase